MMILTSPDFWIGSGFGIVVGACGKYLADKWTDKRRKKEGVEEISQIFKSLYSDMPKLIDEMRQDLQDNPLAREFILLGKNEGYGGDPNKQIFVYRYDEHEELENAVRLLEANGFVDDITFHNTKRFQMTEVFVRLLKESD